MMIGSVERQLLKRLSKRKLHFSLIDPDPKKAGIKRIEDISKNLERIGTDAILVGGSTRVTEQVLDRAIQTIKKYCRAPVILYPGNASGVSRFADAILFMSLLNSRSALWLSGMQALGAPLVKKYKIEPIPMAYLVVEPGMKAGEVGKANAIKRSEPKTAVAYALVAQYLGMRFVYLEAGSGAPQHVPENMIAAVRKSTGIPLIVGGGIRSADAARSVLRAGADIIVTGTILEENTKRAEEIIRAVREFEK